jgi:hypothetical protein
MPLWLLSDGVGLAVDAASKREGAREKGWGTSGLKEGGREGTEGGKGEGKGLCGLVRKWGREGARRGGVI